MKLNQHDILLFTVLDRTYQALALAVQDPVIISNREIDLENGQHRAVHALVKDLDRIDISRVYFYCEDDTGEAIVRERIANAAPHIRAAYKQHTQMYDTMRTLDDAITAKDRQRFKSTAQDLCSKLHAYAAFVADHQEQLAEHSFLTYPNALGTYAYRRPFIVSPVDYNPEQSHKGFYQEISALRGLADKLSITGPLPFEKVSTMTDLGKGWDDGSYRATILLTKMLFKEHLGFSVE